MENFQFQCPLQPNERQHPPDLPNSTTEDPPANYDTISPLTGTTQPLTPNKRNGPPAKAPGDTPCSLRVSQSSQFHSETLVTQKVLVAKDHQYVPCVSLENFRRHVLPTAISEQDVNSVLNAIDIGALKELVRAERKKPRSIQDISKAQENSKAPESSKAQGTDVEEMGKVKKKKEAEFFSHITTIYDKVASAGRQVLGREELSKMDYRPDIRPLNLERENTAIPDCNLVLAASTSCRKDANDANVYYCDVFTTCEFKKARSPKDIYNNQTQIIWDMRHIMREDPCRRFVYGITIEDTQMRIWHANRADIFASYEFNYVENLEVFLGALVQLMFAAKKTDLGWDDSMVRIAPNTYRIRVNKDWYETKEVLSNLAADDLNGHATRVWLATAVEGEKEQSTSGQSDANTEKGAAKKKAKEVVIRDCWPGLGMAPEHELQSILLSKVPETYRELLKKHMFTILSSEKVHIDGKEDNTLDTALHGLDTRTTGLLPIQEPANKDYDNTQPIVRLGLSGSHLSSSARPLSSKKRQVYHTPTPIIFLETTEIRHRYHYRMVMEEVGVPVWRIDDMEHAFIAYRDALIVVALLSACGWVHRDISSGNVYYYEGRGIVGDFEYAKEIDSGKRFETRTGTRNFMAAEVASRTYLFQNVEKKAGPDWDFDEMLASMGQPAHRPKYPPKDRTKQHFFHNPLHDAESVWWGCVELLFKRRIECSTMPELEQQYKEKYRAMMNTASKIFPDNPADGARISFLTSDVIHDELMSTLPPALVEFGNFLTDYCDNLVAHYRQVEQTPDGSIRKEEYGLQRMSKFAKLIDIALPLTRGSKLRSFPREWYAELLSITAAKGKEDADQQAGSKRKATEPPDNAGNSKRSHSALASEV